MYIIPSTYKLYYWTPVTKALTIKYSLVNSLKEGNNAIT